MGKKKLLAILGSPHKNGISSMMLSYVILAAKQAGWHVDTVHLYECDIAFCRGCHICMQTRQCVQQDDIVKLSDLIRSCDVVALAAPTYWANVPAVVKNLFDRLVGVAMEETATFPKPRLSAKQKYLLLTSCHTPFPFSRIFRQSSGALHAMDEFFKTSGMKCLGRITISSAKGKSQLSLSMQNKIRGYFK